MGLREWLQGVAVVSVPETGSITPVSAAVRAADEELFLPELAAERRRQRRCERQLLRERVTLAA